MVTDKLHKNFGHAHKIYDNEQHNKTYELSIAFLRKSTINLCFFTGYSFLLLI